MNFFELLLSNSIYILFPLILYLFYFAYNQSFGKKINDLILDFCLLSSIYFIFSFGKSYQLNIPILTFNIPLIIAYLKKRDMSAIIISIVIVVYYNTRFNYNLIAVITEYVIYFVIYLFNSYNNKSKKWFVHFFILVSGITYLFWIIYTNPVTFNFIIYAIFLLIMYIFINYFTLIVFEKGEAIIRLHMTLKELQQEKQVRTSLFKITHEIKNPIAVCKGYLDMYDVNDKGHSKKYIPIIRSEINRTLLLLQDFLDFNKLKIEKDILDLNLLLEETIDSCEPLLEAKNIECISNIDDSELYILGDYNRLKQVFVNIVKNSIEAIEKDGIIKITIEELKNKVNVIIEDNGEGMSKEVLDKVKEPFFTTKKDGTGLGVALSSEIIEAHKGTISYSSEEKIGTKVFITLPIEKITS